MFDGSWSCLMVKKMKGPVPGVVRDALVVAACQMALDQDEQTLVETDEVSGLVKTTWKSYVVGGRSGILFRAQFDHEGQQDCLVNFLLGRKDLERGKETIAAYRESQGEGWNSSPGKIPIDDLYTFYNLRSTSQMQ